MATADAKPDPLRRLGGGRWETKDGRFQIEPQSGTWVIVDTTQTNEFGLPLVRGPFPSLTAAREAIEVARGEGPVTSPLADRIEQARTEPMAGTKQKPDEGRISRAKGGAAKAAAADAPEPEAPSEPPEPPEPRWFRDLKPAGRARAAEMIARLRALDIDEAEAVARAEILDGRPALAGLALERRLRKAAAAKTPRRAVEEAIEAFLAGEDAELGTGWRLVDDRERRIRKIELSGD